MSSAVPDLSFVETFAGLSADDIALLESRLLPLTVARGDVIVSEGDESDARRGAACARGLAGGSV